MFKLKVIIIGILLCSACTQQSFEIIELIQKTKDENSVSLQLKVQSKVDLNQFAARRLVCQNLSDPNIRVDAFIQEVNATNITAELNICQNNDAHLCQPRALEPFLNNTKLSCQIIFSGMFGRVNQSNLVQFKLNPS